MSYENYTFFFTESSPFSNWYPINFTVDNKNFSSNEQFMMYSKAILFKDNETANKILKTSSPKEQKKLGKQVKNFNSTIWDENKEKIVMKGIEAKFGQNLELSKILQNTKPTLLVEASPYDRIWGIGYSEKDALKVEKEKWGQNLLGKLLTEFRDNLGINGLYYIPNFLSDQEATNIEKYINNSNIFKHIQGTNSRRVAQYGYTYSYDRSGVEKTVPIPCIYRNLINEKKLNIDTKDIDQLIINEYKPGQGINPHIDHPRYFGDKIICISLGSGCEIEFTLDNETKTIYVERGSLYIMSGDARYKWKHSIKHRKHDNGKQRGVRYSLTYRSVLGVDKEKNYMEILACKINNFSLKEYKDFLNTTDLKTLHNIKSYLDDLYYNTDDFGIEDTRYDLLKETLKERDKSYILPVGAKIREGENRVELPYWLGSADKITPNEPEKFEKWLKNNFSNNYVISEKLDGVSCLLYRKNNRTNLYTRGDGIIGADITHLENYFNIPKLNQDISIRGELIIPKAIFNKKYKGTYKNPRNMVSGLIAGKTAREGLKDIHFVTYEIVGDSMPKPSLQLKELKSLQFEVVKYEIIEDLTIDNLSETLIRFKTESDYEIDGIIVQSNKPYDRNISGNPDYMFAFKMLTEEAIHETSVKYVEWNISKWGQMKPVVVIEPVELEGITMSRATAHNAKFVEENNLGPNAVIKITRSKDVIPYIVEVVKQADKPQMPEECFIWDKNHVNISVKKYDEIICVKFISDFFAKLGIKFVSEATVKKLFSNGLDNLIKIISADKKRLLQVPEFQEKSAERIYTNIHNGLQNIKISTVLGASGVFGFGIGIKRLDALILDIPNILSVYKTKTEKEMVDIIMNVEGFSNIMAEKVAKNLKYADQLIKKLEKYATFQKEERVSETMKGKKFVMTGFRDKNLEEEIAKRGGKVTGTVSKNTSVLIVAKKEAKLTGKSQKANELGVLIMEKDEFIKKYI